jgi:hypothetical protein
LWRTCRPIRGPRKNLDAYVDANLLSIFHHEFDHALIDLMALPGLGQEENAADTATMMIRHGGAHMVPIYSATITSVANSAVEMSKRAQS